MNEFKDLYAPRQQGTWVTPRQGLTVGMDLHDWKRFVVRAVLVIRRDPDAERRIRKAQRLLTKTQRVGAQWGGWYVQNLITNVIRDARWDIEDRVNVRMNQLELWS